MDRIRALRPSRSMGLVLRLGVAAIGLAFVLTRVDLPAVGAALAELDPILFLIGAGLISSFHLLPAASWHLLLRALDIRLPYRLIAQTHYKGLAVAGLTPGGFGGDLTRTYILSQSGQSASWVHVALSIVLSRGLSFLILLLTATVATIVAFAANAGAPPVLLDVLVRGLILMAAGGAIGLLGLLVAGRYLLKRLPARLRNRGAELREAFDLARRRPIVFLNMAALLLAFHLGSAIATYLVAVAAGVPISLLAFLPIILALRVVIVLPISINGAGIHEAGLVYLLEQVGVPGSLAFALAILDRSAFLLTMSIGFSLFMRTKKKPPAVRDLPAESRAA